MNDEKGRSLFSKKTDSGLVKVKKTSVQSDEGFDFAFVIDSGESETEEF